MATTDNVDPNITLVSDDGKHFVAKRSLVKPSITLVLLIEDLGDDATKEPIPVPNVCSDVLAMIIDLLVQHKDHYDKMKLEKEAFLEKNPGETPKAYDHKKEMDEWNDAYLTKKLTGSTYDASVNHDTNLVFRFILAANFLEIEYLIYVGVRWKALRIKSCGQSRKALNRLFGIDKMDVPDITLEEEEIQRKNEAWCAIGADQVLPRDS